MTQLLRRHLRHLVAAAATTTLLATLPGAALAQVETSGVKYAPTATVGSSTLQLNGAGTRYKFVVKVYTAGLYLPQKTGNAEQAVTMPGPKRVHVVMLRDIDANELGRLFTRGMQDNASKEDFSKSIPGTIRMSDIFSARKRLAAGDSFSVDYTPGGGTQVLVNGKPVGEPIKEPEFMQSLLRIWLGKNPADEALKEALLGREARPVTNPGQQ